MKLCNKCQCLRWEDWPKDELAARCMSEYRPQSGITPRGRVLSIFSKGHKGRVYRPAWCPYEGERREE